MRLLKDLMDMRGRVALVTGGAGHLGRTSCEALAELGAKVAVLDIAHDSCADAANEVQRRFAVETLSLPVDLADEKAVLSVPKLVLDRFGRLDVIINCAALMVSASREGPDSSSSGRQDYPWRQALEVNLTAPFSLVQSCAEPLAASGHGSVVNISSIYGMVGPDLRLYEGTSMINPAAYAASKGGLLQITRWLATVMAPSVRVNAVVPGGIRRGQPEQFYARYKARTPLGRMATEEDLKGAIAYLASDLSAYVTGHALVVDGGWTAW